MFDSTVEAIKDILGDSEMLVGDLLAETRKLGFKDNDVSLAAARMGLTYRSKKKTGKWYIRADKGETS